MEVTDRENGDNMEEREKKKQQPRYTVRTVLSKNRINAKSELSH